MADILTTIGWEVKIFYAVDKTNISEKYLPKWANSEIVTSRVHTIPTEKCGFQIYDNWRLTWQD